MVTQLKLKILAFGSQIMLSRLTARLDLSEVDVTVCTESSKAVEALNKEPFDMVIVDSLAVNAEIVCRDAFFTAKAPVALMLSEFAADWKKLLILSVDGYLPDEAGSVELMARIRAFSRRKSSNPT